MHATEEQMILRYTLAWIPMVLIAIINGALRELTYGKALPDLRAHQISCGIGVLLFGVYTWCLSLKWPLESMAQAISVGLIWLCLTVAFEFLFGHYVGHHPWSRLLADYNLLAGRLWSLVVLSVATLPLAVFLMKSWLRTN
jgi:hypothetical protein